MTEKVKKILKYYGGDHPGTLSRLAGILNHGYLAGTGKLVIFPVDQGFEHGPAKSFSSNPEAYDPSYHFRLAIEAGCNAYAAPFGFLEACARDFVGEIPLILKVNNSDSLYKNPQNPLPAITSGIEEALRLGCSAIGFTIYPGSGDRNSMYESAVHLGREARKVGLPIVLWSYPRGSDLSKKGETALDVIAYSAQIACQLGAHIIKLKPPEDFFEKEKTLYQNSKILSQTLSDRVAHVLQSAFNGKRIVVFSGGATKETGRLLEDIRLLAKGGAYGSIMGRNVFQRPKAEALKLLRQIMDIYKQSSV